MLCWKHAEESGRCSANRLQSTLRGEQYRAVRCGQSYSDIPECGGPPAPAVVPSVGTFYNSGCFVDSISARDLVAGNKTDQSSTEMTVEKCVAFAQDGGWRYAGVEYGG